MARTTASTEPVTVCSLTGGGCGADEGEIQQRFSETPLRSCPRCDHPGGRGYCVICHGPSKARQLSFLL